MDETFDCLYEAVPDPEEPEEEGAVDADVEVVDSDPDPAWDWEKWLLDRWSFDGEGAFQRFREHYKDDPEALAWVDGYKEWRMGPIRLKTDKDSSGSLSHMFEEDIRHANSLINYLTDHMIAAEGDYDRQQYARLVIETMKARSKLRPAFPALKLDGNSGNSRYFAAGA